MTDQPVQVRALELTDFRCYEHVSATLPDGVSVVIGSNGEGKTTLLEAVAWAALGQSFRGVPDAALVRTGEPRAVLRVSSAALLGLENEGRCGCSQLFFDGTPNFVGLISNDDVNLAWL